MTSPRYELQQNQARLTIISKNNHYLTGYNLSQQQGRTQRVLGLPPLEFDMLQKCDYLRKGD